VTNTAENECPSPLDATLPDGWEMAGLGAPELSPRDGIGPTEPLRDVTYSTPRRRSTPVAETGWAAPSTGQSGNGNDGRATLIHVNFI